MRILIIDRDDLLDFRSEIPATLDVGIGLLVLDREMFGTEQVAVKCRLARHVKKWFGHTSPEKLRDDLLEQ